MHQVLHDTVGVCVHVCLESQLHNVNCCCVIDINTQHVTLALS